MLALDMRRLRRPRFSRATGLLIACTLVVSAPAQEPDAPPEPTQAEFDAAVNEAVERGLSWLQAHQRADGGYEIFQFHSDQTYVAGQTALALLARIASGENKGSERVHAGFRFIQEHPPRLTYEIGLTLMAWDMKAAPVNERFLVAKMSPAELAEYEWPRALDDEERGFLTGLVRALEAQAYKGCWSYGAANAAAETKQADASNTQYAVLGLKAASRMGIDFDRSIFADTLKHFVSHQESSGPKVRYVDKVEARRGKIVEYTRKLRARGWGYGFENHGGSETSAARTNIGIACMLLTQDELLSKGKGRALRVAKQARRDVDEGVLDGLAWLDSHFSVKANHPNEPNEGYYYYYMYSLERTGMLSRRRWIGEHDWYREGALQLLTLQLPDGSWPGHGWDNGLVNTCFALLFLRRATTPGPVTGG